MPYRRNAVISACVAVLALPGQTLATGSCKQMAPTVVSLSGHVYVESKYGPPGFGETPDRDSRIVGTILKLGHAIHVCADSNSSPNPGLEPVHEVELNFNQYKPLASMRRSKIIVTGWLSEGLSATDSRRIRLLVATVSAPDDSGHYVLIYRDSTIATGNHRKSK